MLGGKRYRRPKVSNGQVKMQKCRLDGEIDMCIFFGDGVPRHDRALIMNVFCSERSRLDLSTTKHVYDKSFIEELEARGYDLDTLKFSIEHKSNGSKEGGQND